LVLVLVPSVPLFAAEPDEAAAATEAEVPAPTTPADAEAETPSTPTPPAPPSIATFATLSEAEDAGVVAGVPDNPDAYVEGEILVVLAGEDTEATEVVAVEESLSTLSVEDDGVEAELLSPSLDGSLAVRVELPADVSVEDALLQMANDENVVFAQPNFRYHLLDTDEEPGEMDEGSPASLSPLHIPNDANGWWLDKVGAYDAWDIQRTNGAVTVAVLDTGVRVDHVDLMNNISSLAWDAWNKQPLAKSIAEGKITNNGDWRGHGTQIAGIIAAQANNGQFMAGVSYNAKILPIVVFPQSGDATTESVYDAFAYIISNRQAANIRVVNMSFGGYGSESDDQLLHDIIKNAKNLGILSVVAAGNNGPIDSGTGHSRSSYPSDYEEVISVTSVSSSLTRSSFSDFNAAKDIAAPGEGIFTTSCASSTNTTSVSGTSMAAPVVAGIAALLFAKAPNLSPDKVKEILYTTATDLPIAAPDSKDIYYGHGLVNAQKALEQTPYTVTFDSNGGSVSPSSITRNAGEAIGTLPTPTRAGHGFTGWYTSPTGGTRITAAEKPVANTTYYARWTTNTYTVSFNSNGGSAVSPKTIAYNMEIGALPTPTRAGYILEGWYTAASGGTRIMAEQKITSNVTYFAHWGQDLNGTVVTIASTLVSSRVFDIEAGSVANGGRVQIYAANTTPAQRFRLERVTNDGYYVIRNVGSDKVLDVPAAMAFSGAAIQQYTANGTAAQKWKLFTNTDGSYTIASALNENLVLDLPGAQTANSTKLQLYQSNGTGAQKFRLNALVPLLPNGTYTITTALASNKVLDVAAAGTANGTNIQIYQSNGTAAQKFTLSYDTQTGYYTITNPNARKVLDVAAAGTTNGTNVQLYQSNGTRAQKWTIAQGSAANTYILYSACSGLVLDVSGAQTANSTNVWTYAANGTAAQAWKFS
jgi:uncharacterized repeat protein (TIGR02543 family)